MLLRGPDPATHALLDQATQDFVCLWPMGGLLILGQHIKVVQSLDYGTLATDGVSIFINPSYIAKVFAQEGIRGVIFRLCHEYLHIYLNHVDRALYRDRKLWGPAIDIVTNRLTSEILSTAGDPWPTPADGISPNGWDAFATAELVYQELERRQKAQKPMPKPQSDPYGTGEGGEFGGKDLLPSPFNTEAEQREWQDGITTEICQAHAVMEMTDARALPDVIKERLSQIKEGRVPWSRLLTGRLLGDTGGQIASYSPPRRRLYPLLILPRYLKAVERDLVIAVDNSASVGKELHQEFQAAIMPAARQADRTHIIGFDAVVREHFTTRRPKNIKDGFKFAQGSHSSTSVVGVFELIDKIRPSGIAILTDGHVQLPTYKPRYKRTIWCTPRGGRTQPWGRNFIMDVAW